MLNRVRLVESGIPVLVIALMHGLLLWPTKANADSIEIPSVVLDAQTQRAEAIEQASAATISIFGLDGGGGGSGVIITPDGLALTNYHVSSACGDHMRCGLNDGKLYDAVIVGIDATGDVSLIQLFGRDDFPTAPLADSSQVRVGQWCFAAGNPFVLATNLQPSVSLGLVSGVHRYQYPAGTLLEYADCIQTDAAVNPGNSGGPLFNLAGEVIGINGRCSFEKRGRVNVGVGYAISSNQLKYFIGMLQSGRLIDHATLGATVSTDDSDAVVVSNILNGSDAYRRGLRFGDEIVSLADRSVDTTNTFKNILGTLPKDWRVPLRVRRDGKELEILVRLDGVHTDKQLADLVSQESAQASDEEDTDPPATEQNDEPRHPAEPDFDLIESQLEYRTGFANYHYNRVHRGRLWRSIQSWSDFSDASHTWQLDGTLAGESTTFSAELVLRGDSRLNIGSVAYAFAPDSSPSEIVESRSDGGFLVGLCALQDLLMNGPEKIGDTIYLGEMPAYLGDSITLAEQPWMSVLETTWLDAKVRFSIELQSGHIRLIEVFGDSVHDPVEIYLNDYRSVQNADSKLVLPHQMRLQYGQEPMAGIELATISLVEREEPAE